MTPKKSKAEDNTKKRILVNYDRLKGIFRKIFELQGKKKGAGAP